MYWPKRQSQPVQADIAKIGWYNPVFFPVHFGGVSVPVNIGVHFGIFAIYIFLYINIYLYYLCKYEFINFYVYQHKI